MIFSVLSESKRRADAADYKKSKKTGKYPEEFTFVFLYTDSSTKVGFFQVRFFEILSSHLKKTAVPEKKKSWKWRKRHGSV
ncbi:MAG: hypothetical protein II776_02515 [Clostridia bacterium]|nr:hypothetical protein [Clostridia bacterium]